MWWLKTGSTLRTTGTSQGLRNKRKQRWVLFIKYIFKNHSTIFNCSMITVFLPEKKKCVPNHHPGTGIFKWYHEVLSENQASLKWLYFRSVFSSDNKEECKMHFLFWQHCPKNNYSKWVPLKCTSHFTKWNKVILFNFRNVFAQPNDKCHLDPWCINCNNFLDTNFRVGLPNLHASFHDLPAWRVTRGYIC